MTFAEKLEAIRRTVAVDSRLEDGLLKLCDLLEEHTHEVYVRTSNSDVQSGDAGTGRTEPPS